MRVRVTPLNPELEVFEGFAPFPPEVGDTYVVELEDEDAHWITEEVASIGLGSFTCVDGECYVLELLDRTRALA